MPDSSYLKLQIQTFLTNILANKMQLASAVGQVPWVDSEVEICIPKVLGGEHAGTTSLRT